MHRASLVVRDAAFTDADSVEAVHWASMEAAYGPTVTGWPITPRNRAMRVATWGQWLSDPSVVVLVGTLESRVVGLCTVRASEDEGADATKIAEMPTLYVHPQVWHRGYGRMLCAEAIARARLRGFATLTLWVVESNTRARAFYTRYGFGEDGSRKVVLDSPSRVEAIRFHMDLR